MIERFQIGFANRTLGYRLPDKNRKEGAELRVCLQRPGIIRESGHEQPVLIVASLIPLLATALVLLLVRERRAGTA